MARALSPKTLTLFRALLRKPPQTSWQVQRVTGLPLKFVTNDLWRLQKAGYLKHVEGGYVLCSKGYAALDETPPEPSGGAQALSWGNHSGRPEKTQPEPASQASEAFGSLDDVLDSFIDRVAHTLVAQLDASIEDRIKPEINALLQLKADEAVATLRPSQAKRPKVAVIGLLPVQAQEIKHAFDDLLDLSFHHAHTDASKTARRVQGAEAVFVLTKFMNHMVTGALKASGVPFIPCNGAVTSLKAEIERWLDQQTRGEARAA